MRSQVYEWTNLAPTTNGSNIRQSSNPTQVEIAADKSLDIFIGGKGTNITQPASTTATQFVVIEDIAASPQSGGALNVRINTTDYFRILMSLNKPECRVWQVHTQEELHLMEFYHRLRATMFCLLSV